MRWVKDAPDHWHANLRGGHSFSIWEADKWVYEYWRPESANDDEPTKMGTAPSMKKAKESCERLAVEMKLIKKKE